MKIQVLQENLSEAVNLATRFTSSRAQLPVLANIMLSTKKNKLLLSATNLELSINISLGAKVENEGKLTVPARILSEIVSNLSTGPINLESQKEQLKIETGNFQSTVSGMNASDFPAIPEKLKGLSVKAEKDGFIDSLSQVLFAVSSDETRPTLTGVLFLVEKNKDITLVSTDGFRLSKKILKEKSTKVSFKVILPKTALNEIVKVADEGSLSFSYSKEDNQVIFDLSESIISSRIIEGSFPDFEKIIPKSRTIKVDLAKDDFIQAVKLASVFARDSANVVKLSIKTRGVTLKAESQYSGSQETSVEAKVEGDLGEKKNFEIAFNYRFLEEFSHIVKSDSLVMEFTDPNSPGVFLDPEDNDFLHLIMPVKLQS
jgi:DNA polymerase-3 subunit beta